MRIVVWGVVMAACCLGQGEDAVKWTLRTDGAARAGGKVKAVLHASIREGWHLYSMKELDGGPRPTRISLAGGRPFMLAGRIEAPEPLVLHDGNFDMDVEFYVGSADFTLPLAVAADARPGKQTLTVTAHYQACNDRMCLPPKSVTVEAPVELK